MEEEKKKKKDRAMVVVRLEMIKCYYPPSHFSFLR